MAKKKKRIIPKFEPLQKALIDSHCHLLHTCFGEELDAALARLKAAGVERVVNIGAGYGKTGNAEVLRLYHTHSFLHPSVGIHPHDAKEIADEPEEVIASLEAMARTPGVVAYGEIGLDYYYENASIEVQKWALKQQLDLALRIQKPIIIHTRDADKDIVSILDEKEVWGLGVVFHCFSGDWDFAQALLERGAYISLSGIVTFPKASALHLVAEKLPLERLMVETDSPFLAPVPYRGRRNEPSYLHATVRRIADLRGMNPDEVAGVTSENARRFFQLPGA